MFVVCLCVCCVFVVCLLSVCCVCAVCLLCVCCVFVVCLLCACCVFVACLLCVCCMLVGMAPAPRPVNPQGKTKTGKRGCNFFFMGAIFFLIWEIKNGKNSHGGMTGAQ